MYWSLYTKMELHPLIRGFSLVGLSDSKNTIIMIVKIVVFTIVNAIMIVAYQFINNMIITKEA